MGYSRKSGENDPKTKQEQLLDLERHERDRRGDPTYGVPAPIMAIMSGLVDRGSEPVRVFQWFKDVHAVGKGTLDGQVKIHCASRFLADNLFQYAGDLCLKAFGTRDMVTMLDKVRIRRFA